MGARRVCIITDSTACIPVGLVEELAIRVVPVSLIFADGRSYRDRPGFDSDFACALAAAPKPPTTSAPAPGEYLQAMQAAVNEGYDVLCITVSAAFSGMLHSALRAADILRERQPRARVEVFDSRNAAMAQGFVVLAAARSATCGLSLEQCLHKADEVAARGHLVFALDSLRYLARGGRVPSAVAWVAELLDLKPVVQYDSRGVRLVERTRHMKKALIRMGDLPGRLAPGKGALHIAVQDAGAPREAQALFEVVAERYAPASLLRAEFTSAMMAHTGPGTVGVAFYREPSSDSPVGDREGPSPEGRDAPAVGGQVGGRRSDDRGLRVRRNFGGDQEGVLRYAPTRGSR